MLGVAICEDEEYLLDNLKSRVGRHLKAAGIDARIVCFRNAAQLAFSGEVFDIVLMDILMEGIDGMEAVRLLRAEGKKSQVIFVTSSREYVFQAFDVEAVHYLMKPVSDESLFHALDKAVLRSGYEDRQAITVARGGAVQIIGIRDIQYCEVMDHRIYVCTAAGRIDYSGKLDSLQEQLDERFFRCHRSYIVNLSFVSGVDGDLIIMDNGERVPVSRRKRQEFNQRLLAAIRGEVL